MATSLRETVEATLRDDGWPVACQGTAERPVVQTWFAGTTGTWPCDVRVFEASAQVVFDSVLPLVVPEDRRAEVAYVLVRANWELLTGAFTMDADSGEVRFRSALVVPQGSTPPPGVVLAMTYANVVTVDRCLGDLGRFLDGSAGVDETIARLGH